MEEIILDERQAYATHYLQRKGYYCKQAIISLDKAGKASVKSLNKEYAQTIFHSGTILIQELEETAPTKIIAREKLISTEEMQILINEEFATIKLLLI